jgi:deoxyribose-phosphate aldolase
VPDPSGFSLDRLPRFVDISCVQAFHNRDDIDELAREARESDFVSAHVLPNRVPYLRERLEGSRTLVGSPVGFPSGGATTATKVYEAERLLRDGAQELDVVANIGRLRSGDPAYVTSELAEVAAVVGGAVPLRVILEVGHLGEKEIRLGCDCAVEAGIGWVKTATGWSGVPSTVEHIRIIAGQLGGRARMKAAGGIRDLATIQAMADLGVTRFGMNAAVAKELARQAAEAAGAARAPGADRA